MTRSPYVRAVERARADERDRPAIYFRHGSLHVCSAKRTNPRLLTAAIEYVIATNRRLREERAQARWAANQLLKETYS